MHDVNERSTQDTRRIGGLEKLASVSAVKRCDTRRIGGLEKKRPQRALLTLDTRRIGGLETGKLPG